MAKENTKCLPNSFTASTATRVTSSSAMAATASTGAASGATAIGHCDVKRICHMDRPNFYGSYHLCSKDLEGTDAFEALSHTLMLLE